MSGSRQAQPSPHPKVLPFRPNLLPAVPPNLPQLQLLAPLPHRPRRGERRACALLRPYPAFHVSLPSLFPPQLPLRRHDWPADLLSSANKRRPLAPVLLGRTKQKQTEREGPETLRGGGRGRGGGQAGGPGTWAGGGGGGGLRGQYLRHGSHARENCALSPSPGLLGGSRTLGGGGGVEAAAGSGPRGWDRGLAAFSEPRRPGRAHPNARAAESGPRFSPSGPGARRRRPNPPVPLPLLAGRAGRASARGSSSSPRRPRFHFNLGGVALGGAVLA